MYCFFFLVSLLVASVVLVTSAVCVCYTFSWDFNCKVVDYIMKHIPPAESADAEPPQDPHRITEEIFQHEDQDRDGYISYEEFSGPKHDEL